MNWAEACNAMLEGNTVRRSLVPSRTLGFDMEDGELTMWRNTYAHYPELTVEDFEATDWEVVE